MKRCCGQPASPTVSEKGIEMTSDEGQAPSGGDAPGRAGLPFDTSMAHQSHLVIVLALSLVVVAEDKRKAYAANRRNMRSPKQFDCQND
jgi:hypothetical protein